MWGFFKYDINFRNLEIKDMKNFVYIYFKKFYMIFYKKYIYNDIILLNNLKKYFI